MAANILAIIQFDDNSPPEEKPFTNDPSVWDLTGDLGLWGCKDYAFISAISGIRNTTDKQPLIALRGLPENRTGLGRLDLLEDVAGWLTHSEILACLEHFGVGLNMLDASVVDVLGAMRLLRDRYGDERVYLVFAILD